MEYLRAAGVALIAVVFAASSVSKLRDFRGFARSVPVLVPMPAGWVTPVSVVVVAAEAGSAVLVAVPATATAGFLLASALLLAFTVAIAASLRRGRPAPCRCFGVSETPVGPRHLVRNSVLLALTLLGALAPGPLPPLAGAVVAFGAGVVVAVLVIAMDDIAVVFARSS
ncbi:MauE/DoxX family redox-associated membrane protein [Amycolatopsis vancoresmycina]|uniref:Methylamine utilization protein MauE n=1 Tax=Amycolatopsis vancoresmycina DSM 44592 TaxID=1292037 RepID=R1G0G8_9PSEU|nr:MauE/DoxX family redox-associated membrane protein [Amycolatopsis vancoresmycina]EOD65073.1 methylamine utilization protein MauE [Amycolatopsis vancoresmycina DSM 44592]